MNYVNKTLALSIMLEFFSRNLLQFIVGLPSLGRIHAMLAQNLISILEGCLAFVAIFVSVVMMP